MRKINYIDVVNAVAKLCRDANYYLGEDVINAFETGLKQEESPTGKGVLEQLIENADIACNEEVPMCQDTGVAVVFLELGQDVYVEGGLLYDAVEEGVREGYQTGYLRKSMVENPFKRNNTGDNTPAIIHTNLVAGDKLKILVAPKGGGSENMSAINMMAPAAGEEGVKDFIIDTVRKAGPNPCPPIVVGVGIGGNFEKSAMLAKEALIRPIGELNKDEDIAKMEKELLEKINNLGIGPQGMGGRVTALAVHIKTHPCHIASLPVAVNINCHATRHKSVVL
ncbi:fumarate hydratase [Metallumcola ferriviriculae]|uniref:Fumarate hydratase n=1 Tax=Metallumcola ferriviriculae TaxID=3039180 RepID=A0AAU0UPK8_9FIRM|nr:fumarate hydratase [Desulfitibacteraceae bacterium MK1]